MHFRIYTVIFCAFLIGHAAAVQSNGFSFPNDDADIEGSGGAGEVTHDLGESSGSGSGPPEDDEDRTDTPSLPGIPIEEKPVVRTEILKPEIAKPEEPPRSPEDPSVVMTTKHEERQTSFFAQPGILAAVIGGAVVGLLCAILVVMFIVYRMRKKDEGSYALGEPKQSPNQNSYSRSGNNKEFYA